VLGDRFDTDTVTAQRALEINADLVLMSSMDVPGVRGLRKDLPAVVAGLTLPYSNGPIGGTNTKVGLVKRQKYGRASFALLRPCILLAKATLG